MSMIGRRATPLEAVAVAVLPVVVLGGGLTALVGFAAFAAVAAALWLCFVLFSIAPEVGPARAGGS